MRTSVVSRIVGLVLAFPILLGAQTLEEGKAAMRNRDYAGARRIFESLIEHDEKNAEAQYQLGMVYMVPSYEGRDIDEAIDRFEEAVDLVPDNPAYLFMLGAAYGTRAQSAGIIKQAFLAPKIKNTFERVVELDPNHLQARIGLAQYYLQAPGIMGGDTAKGWAQLREVIRIDPLHGTMTRARIYERNTKLPEAEADWQRLCKSYPGEWRVWKGSAYFYLRTDRLEQAMTGMRKYVELRPDTADSYESLGEVFVKRGESDQAIATLTKAITIDRTHAPAFFQLGEAYLQKGRKPEAREAFERYLALTPNEKARQPAEERLKQLQ